jgi:hypothetical protein
MMRLRRPDLSEVLDVLAYGLEGLVYILLLALFLA